MNSPQDALLLDLFLKSLILSEKTFENRSKTILDSFTAVINVSRPVSLNLNHFSLKLNYLTIETLIRLTFYYIFRIFSALKFPVLP